MIRTRQRSLTGKFVPSRLPLAFGLACAAAIVGGGCAKSPTVVGTTIATDDTVAPLLLLRAIAVSDGDPTRQASSSFHSLASGDAADRPGPYRFPLAFPVSVPASLAGSITLTIEGLDWDTGNVIARGATTAEVVKEQQTRANVTLTAVASTGGDAATDSDGDSDGGGGGDTVDGGIDPDALPDVAASDGL
ncbi:MAG: hypothetical protein ABJA82_02065 [Myxococcales bacterium]